MVGKLALNRKTNRILSRLGPVWPVHKLGHELGRFMVGSLRCLPTLLQWFIKLLLFCDYYLFIYFTRDYFNDFSRQNATYPLTTSLARWQHQHMNKWRYSNRASIWRTSSNTHIVWRIIWNVKGQTLKSK